MTNTELDILVTEHVMGLCAHKWQFQRSEGWVSEWEAVCEKCGAARGGGENQLGPRDGAPAAYSTSIAAALQVVNHNDGWGHDFQLERRMMSSLPWTARFINVTSGQVYASFASTAPLAIVKAALYSKGVSP